MKQFFLKHAPAASRLLRIFLSVALSLLSATILASFLWSPIEGHSTHRAASGLFLIMFLSVFIGPLMLAATGVFFVLDRVALRKGPLSAKQNAILLAIPLFGVLVGFVQPILGVFWLFLLVYWLLTGRVAGREGWSLRHFWQTRWDEKLYLVAMVILLTPVLTDRLSSSYYSRLAYDAGTPAYQPKHARRLNADIKSASRRFPDAQSCLTEGADALKREDLTNMNWDKITTSGEMRVFTFRLLHGWGDVTEARSWFEAQGFRMSRTTSSEHPYVERDASLRVTASWSVRYKGPRYPTRGWLRRVFSATPYSMSVNATYSTDGKTLRFVEASASTL